MFFSDRLTLDKRRINSDGYMAIHARAARTGVYQYLGREVDPEGKHFAADQVVNVYRSPDEVFDKASMASFIGKPITDDHPDEAVTAANWRDLARGTIMGAQREVADDGEYLDFSLAFMDAETIGKIDDGKKELSNGYGAELIIEDGVAPDGTEFQARQVNITGNHVALVDAGRAGSQCALGDAKKCEPIPSDQVRQMLIDQRTYDDSRKGVKTGADTNPIGDQKVPKLILIDGHQIDISNVDVAEATITKLVDAAKQSDKALADAQTELATAQTDLATAKTEITDLKAQLDAKQITPAMLRDAAKSYADVSAKAEALGVEVADDADEAAIKRAVVDAKLGDLAKDWSDEQVNASFLALTKDAKPAEKAPAKDRLAEGIASHIGPITDASTVLADQRRKALNRKSSAYLADGAAA